jgi:hypothetical protein
MIVVVVYVLDEPLSNKILLLCGLKLFMRFLLTML